MLYPLFFFINIPSIHGFIRQQQPKQLYNKQKNMHLLSNPTPNPHHDNIIIKKLRNISKLTRSGNIIPTLLLSVSGGWIMNPSISNLIYSAPFITSNINAILIMSLSMILNDLFDIEVDKLNNPSRPLITGEISKIEAITFSGLLFLIIEYLTNTYLSGNIQFITNLILLDILLYTPFIKKITFIKNVNCALIVSFALFYSGLSVSDHNLLINNKYYNILSVTMNYIFWGSINNELMMDISDLEGDKQTGIKTLPVIINKPFSLFIVHSILFCNTMSNSLSLAYIYNNILYGIIPVLLYFPIFFDLLKVRRLNYSSFMITKTLNNSVKPMFLFLLYMCVLSYKL
jgi:geranylgeranylglycerol-phosphate geranylgeranyltransferase